MSDKTSFKCESNETIIDGALRNGIFLEHSCRRGRCNSCKYRVLSGETISEVEELPLTAEDKNAGYILTCVRTPVSDIQLQAEDLSRYGLVKTKTLPAKIKSIYVHTSVIIEVVLRVPPTQQVQFLAGQYLNTIWKGIKRSYSIASASEDSEIHLLIKNYLGGEMSAYWFGQAKSGDLLRVEVPHGTFFLRDHPGKENLIFIATGTGIAPIKAILQSSGNLKKLTAYRKVIVLWGMRYTKDIFWQPSIDFVEFIPVLSRENPTKKYVQDVLGQLDIDFSKTVVYACGADQMIQEAKGVASQRGLSTNDFHSDAFVASN